MRADLERLRSLARDLEEEEWLMAKAHVLAAVAEIEAHRAQNVGANEGRQERARRRIQALGAAISRRSWSDVETAHAAIRDAHDRPEVYDRPNVG
ncbi:hypothetical protein [Methylobacterium oryzisoli]|uniref:hypothetical protein n=1 Tax=Methylobacterium oryzisoli TaxID=3385502 RepID=UPI003892511C